MTNAVARVVLPRPVPSYEPWGLRHRRHHLLAQMAFGDLLIADRDRNDDCVHRASLSRLASSLYPRVSCTRSGTFSSDIAYYDSPAAWRG
jgi:hypothetical protein